MVLSFKQRFVAKILTRRKLHTIRTDEKKRWKVGSKIHFATGVRTKQYRQFAEGVCTKIDDIEIKYFIYHKGNDLESTDLKLENKPEFLRILKNGKYLKIQEIKDLMNEDGFNSVDEFTDWFKDDFSGRLIHWKITRNY